MQNTTTELKCGLFLLPGLVNKSMSQKKRKTGKDSGLLSLPVCQILIPSVDLSQELTISLVIANYFENPLINHFHFFKLKCPTFADPSLLNVSFSLSWTVQKTKEAMWRHHWTDYTYLAPIQIHWLQGISVTGWFKNTPKCHLFNPYKNNLFLHAGTIFVHI